MSDDRTIRVRLLAEINSYVDGMKKAAAATADFGQNIAGQGDAVKKDIEAVGHAALIMAGTMGVAFGIAIKSAIDWETAWAGVTKTVDGSASEMQELEDGLRGLATTLPATHQEIAAVAEAAGQLGVQREAIVGFTKTMVDLGETTNLSADEAATSIAQMANIMGTDLRTEIDNFGATLVALGNAGASTESDIMEMALRLAGAGKLIGASEADVLALANAMSSMGIQAELGGGAMSRILLKMYSAAKSGGEALEQFGAVAEKSGDQFAATFEGEPLDALDEFLQGLTRIEDAGGNVIGTLKDMGIRGVQDLQVLLRLKGAGDLLAESVELGSRAWLENSALIDEANKRYDTAASRLSVLRNQVTDVAINVGDQFLPVIKGATDALGTFVTGFGQMDGIGQTVATGLGVAAVGITGLIGAVGTIGPKIKGFSDSLATMGTGGAFVARNLGAIAGAIGGITLAIGLYSWKLGENAKKQAEAEAAARAYADAIEEQGASVGELTDLLALEEVLSGDIGEAFRDAGADASVFVEALRNTGAGAEEMIDGLNELQRAADWHPSEKPWERWKQVIEDGALDSMPALRDALVGLQEDEVLTGSQMSEFIASLIEQNGALEAGQVAAENKAAAETAAAEATDANASASERAKRALEEQAAAAQMVTDAIEEMIDAERAAIDPLFGMLDATQGNVEANKALNELLASGTASAEEIAAAQQKAAESALELNGASMTLAGAIEAGTVDLEIAKAMLSDWVEQGLITQETADAMGVKFDAANEKAKLLAGDKVGSITVEVMTDTLKLDAWIARIQWLKDNSTINVRMTGGLGNRPVFSPKEESRWGNVFAYARGGITPAHIAGNSLLKYAEPETGGEAFIPRRGNRSRSLGILDTAAGWYGATVAPRDPAPMGVGAISLGDQTIQVVLDGRVVAQTVVKQAGTDRGFRDALKGNLR